VTRQQAVKTAGVAPATFARLASHGSILERVAHVIADAIRSVYDCPGTFAGALEPHAARFGLRHGDGLGLLRWLLDLVGDPQTSRWMDEANREPTERARPEARAR
jgi:hypothetical protein